MRPRWARVLIATWALLQLGTAPALALVDGLTAPNDAALVGGHVEEHSSQSCQPPHPADCALCQSLSSHAANVASVPALTWPIVRHRGAIERASASSQTVALDLSHSRAPPVA